MCVGVLRVILFSIVIFSMLAEVKAQTTSNSISVVNGQLYLNSEEAPLLYGAEVEYFKIRGGPEKNISKKVVVDLWARALDKIVEAGMNSVSFHIPWDFHEYTEGKFDFTGVADEDNDGNPDYPSRDLVTFLKMIESRGIISVLIKPGPFTIDKWGYSDVGSVPFWFHKKNPDAHSKTSLGFKTRYYDLAYEPFLKYVQTWFEALYSEVLKVHIGNGKIIKFIQLDSEETIIKHSIYSQDYNSRAVKRFQIFLKDRYQHINYLNRAYSKQFNNFDEIKPPANSGGNKSLERDWYEFQENNYLTFLDRLRKMWDGLDTKDNVIFTNEDSNSSFENGLLTNHSLKNSLTKSGLLSLNIKTKSYDINSPGLLNPLHNFPFKMDLDIKLENVGSQAYFGFKNNWVIGSSLQGSSFLDSHFGYNSRKQLYLSAIGQGMKALFIDSFVDGWGWDWDWKFNEIENLIKELKLNSDSLSEEQLSLLQSEFDKKFFVGINVKSIITAKIKENGILSTDGAIDINGKAKDAFALLKEIGQKVVIPYGRVLAKARPIEDEVVIWKEFSIPIKNWVQDMNVAAITVDWTGGLLGALMQSKISPAIAMRNVDFLPFSTAKIIFSQDSGQSDINTAANVRTFLHKGGTFVNFLGSSLMKELGIKAVATRLIPETKIISINYSNIVTQPIELPVLSSPIYTYQIPSDCTPKLTWKSKPVAFSCKIEGGTFIQVGTLLHEDFNSNYLSSNTYSSSQKMRLLWFENLMREAQVIPKLKWGSDQHRVTVIGRYWDDKKSNDSQSSLPSYFLTIKNFENVITTLKIAVPRFITSTKADDPSSLDGFEITELNSTKITRVPLREINENGYMIKLLPQGIDVLIFKPYYKITN